MNWTMWTSAPPPCRRIWPLSQMLPHSPPVAMSLRPRRPLRVGLAGGGQYAEISVLISNDAGATFTEASDSRVRQHPVTVVFDGLDSGASASLQSHPSSVTYTIGGLIVSVPAGVWNAADIRNE